jgi:tetratricopeptide (TPR) repeat protein
MPKPSTAAARSPWWPLAAACAAAMAAAVWAYTPALHGPFLFDDQALPFFSPRFGEQTLLEAVRGVRPFLMFSFWVNNRMAGVEPFQYHLWNLILHLANALLVFLIVRRLLANTGAEGRRREWIAAFAGGVFLLHPVQTEAVSYVASRSETLSAFFFYAALAVFLYRKTPEISWARAAAVIAAYGAAVSTKEHTVTLVALLLLADYYWNPGFSLAGVRRNWRLYGPLFLAAAGGIAVTMRLVRGSLSAGFGLKNLPWYDYFYTQCRALWLYFRLFLWPAGQNGDYDYPISRSLLDRGAVFGLLGLVALVAAAWVLRKRFPLASFGVLAALAMFSPTSSIMPILDAAVERRLYLPMLGLVLVLAGALDRWRPRAALAGGVAVVVLAVLAALTFQRNHVWADDLVFWQDVVAKSPHNGRGHFQLGVSYYGRGRCQEAAAHYQIAARLLPPDERLRTDWALAEDCLGRPAEAIRQLETALRIQPSAYIYAMMGMVYGKHKQYAEALAALEAAEKLDPAEDLTYLYRGNVYAVTGETARAIEQYRLALQRNPDNQQAARALGRLMARPPDR